MVCADEDEESESESEGASRESKWRKNTQNKSGLAAGNAAAAERKCWRESKKSRQAHKHKKTQTDGQTTAAAVSMGCR